MTHDLLLRRLVSKPLQRIVLPEALGVFSLAVTSFSLSILTLSLLLFQHLTTSLTRIISLILTKPLI